MREKITALNLQEFLMEEKRKAWALGKQRKRFFLDADGWKAVVMLCAALSGPDIGVIEPHFGMTFMGVKLFSLPEKRKGGRAVKI